MTWLDYTEQRAQEGRDIEVLYLIAAVRSFNLEGLPFLNWRQS